MATLSLRSPKIIITSRNRVSTPEDFPRRILPIDDRHGVISGTWLHSADVATTSHFLRDEGRRNYSAAHTSQLYKGSTAQNFRTAFVYVLLTSYLVTLRADPIMQGGLIRLLIYNSLANVCREEVVD
jgi:hypothetical protein